MGEEVFVFFFHSGSNEKRKGKKRMSELEVGLRWVVGLLGVLLGIIGAFLLTGQKNHGIGGFFVIIGAILAIAAVGLRPITP